MNGPGGGYDRSARREALGSRFIKIAGVLAGFAACVGLLVFLIFLFQPPKPAAVVLVGADYATNLTVPHNLLGWKGLEGIEAVSRTPRPWTIFNPASLQLIQRPTTLSQPEQWDALIQGLSQSARSQKTILFVLALHGATTPRGLSGPRRHVALDRRAAGPEADHRFDEAIAPRSEQDPRARRGPGRGGLADGDDLQRLRPPAPGSRAGDPRGEEPVGARRLGRRSAVLDLRGAGAIRVRPLHHRGTPREGGRFGWTADPGRAPRLCPQERQELGMERPGSHPGTGALAQGRPGQGEGRGRARPALARRGLPGFRRRRPRRPPPSPWIGPALEGPWRRFLELDRLEPHPSAYSPRRWREYRATLVRREELSRSGATPDQVRPLDARLSTLESSLRSERFLARLPESAQNSLVMHVVQGGVVDPRHADPPEYLRFWSPPRGADPSSMWNALRQADPQATAEPLQPLRCRIDDFLIRQAAVDPSFRNLATAADRLDQTRGTDYPQPAEAHFLIMLRKQLDRPPNSRGPSFWPRASQAILVRRRAERAALGMAEMEPGYPYSEQVHPWIKATIEKADEQRRLGEDRIFSSEESDWAGAQKSLAAADGLYRQAEESASLVRAALTARDRLLAGLPDYSRWLAHRHPDDLSKDDLSASFSELWSQAHKLVDQLERGGDSAAAKLLNGRAVGSRFNEVVRRFEEQARGISSDRVREDWQAATAAAVRPLQRFGRAGPAERPLGPPGDHPEARPRGGRQGRNRRALRGRQETGRRALAAARRIQGSMALAVLGNRWFDDPAFKDQERIERIGQRLLTPIEEDEADRSWWKEIAAVGSAIGQRWQRIEPEIGTLTGEDSRSRELTVFQERLERASRLGRRDRRRGRAAARNRAGGDGPRPSNAGPRPAGLAGASKLARPLVRRGPQGRHGPTIGRWDCASPAMPPGSSRRAPTVPGSRNSSARTTSSASKVSPGSPSPASGAGPDLPDRGRGEGASRSPPAFPSSRPRPPEISSSREKPPATAWHPGARRETRSGSPSSAP